MEARRLKQAVLAGAILLAAAAFFPFSGDATQAGPKPGVPATAEFVGVEACAKCHETIFDLHGRSGMGQALHMPDVATILRENPRLTFKNGPYTYQIVRDGTRSIYSVTDGARTVSAPISFAVGQGKAGQTYVYQIDGVYYESSVSYYRDIKGLDWTIGHTPPEKGISLVEVLGRATPADELRECLNCHSTGAIRKGQLHLDKLVPGVNCESCHGPGSAHVAAMTAANPEAAVDGDLKIWNPGHLSGDELTQDFCGKCHRSAEQVLFMPDRAGINNVRFQPYRIFNSKCYSDDKRISCIGCHDPHGPVVENIAAYDEKCLSCHVLKGKKAGPETIAPACPVGTKECASCHMPKIDLPGSHMLFTDHRIRIVRPGEPFPQ